jgi:choline dehydrogenase-like flavoprotein
MADTQTTWDFETLAKQDDNVLEQVLKTGAPIRATEVASYEFRGWNMNPTTVIIGTRKFKKGFYRDPDTGGFWGYNVRVQQGSIGDPWIALPSEDNPMRFYFFGVSDPTPAGLYPNSLVVDYRRWKDNLVLDPVRYTVDYIVAADPANKNLLLGKSYSETPLGHTFLGYFVLERHNPSGYIGPNPLPILNDAQQKTLRAVLECQMEVLRPSGYADDLDAVVADVEGFLRDASGDARCLVSVLLEKIAADTLFHPFWEWDVPRRKAWLVDLAKAPLVGGKQMRDLLGTVLSLGWLVIYARPAGRQLHGANASESIDPKTGKPALIVSVKEPDYPPDYLSKKYRVCVIGSGAGGSLAAARLAEAGIGPLLVVEAGKWINPEDYPRLRDDQALRKCYMSGGVQPALSSPIPVEEFLLHGRVSTVNVLQGSLVGGGPAVNNAICFPISPPETGQSRWPEWQTAGIPFTYEELNSVYQIIRGELDLAISNVDDAAGWRSYLFAPNGNGWSRLDVAVSDCLGCGGCNTGCRYGRKNGGLGGRSYLERARKAGAIIGSELRAERFDIANGKARRLVLQDLRRNVSVSVEADVFVLAAGPLASTAILARTGLGLTLPLGRRASANIVTPVYGVFPNHNNRPCEPGLQMCYYAGSEGTLLRETWFHYPGSIAVSLPGWFEEHLKRIQHYSSMACIGVVVPTGPHGQVGNDGRLFLALNESEFKLMKRGIADAARDLFAANATEIYLASKDSISFDRTQKDNLEALLDQAIDEQGDLSLATAHPQGGSALSKDNAIAVVGSNFQVRGVTGVFVADASLFPAPCGVNPMMTTLALAHMAAEETKKVLA